MGKFEDDLKRVRLEEKFNSADWRGFLHMVDCNEAVKAFIKKNKDFFVMDWKARNYKKFKRCLEYLYDHVYFPEAQKFFYAPITKFYIVNFKVEKKSAGFGHCRFVVKLVWPFVIYYRRIADVLEDNEIKSSEFAKMEGAKHNEIYCKEYPFEKEYSFEFAQCGKTPKWILNNIYLNFIHDRFYAITQQMKNPPKSVEEFTGQN